MSVEGGRGRVDTLIYVSLWKHVLVPTLSWDSASWVVAISGLFTAHRFWDYWFVTDGRA